MAYFHFKFDDSHVTSTPYLPSSSPTLVHHPEFSCYDFSEILDNRTGRALNGFGGPPHRLTNGGTPTESIEKTSKNISTNQDMDAHKTIESKQIANKNNKKNSRTPIKAQLTTSKRRPPLKKRENETEREYQLRRGRVAAKRFRKKQKKMLLDLGREVESRRKETELLRRENKALGVENQLLRHQKNYLHRCLLASRHDLHLPCSLPTEPFLGA